MKRFNAKESDLIMPQDYVPTNSRLSEQEVVKLTTNVTGNFDGLEHKDQPNALAGRQLELFLRAYPEPEMAQRVVRARTNLARRIRPVRKGLE